MSDYTPTTEEVRRGYTFWMNQNDLARGFANPIVAAAFPGAYTARFNSWLETVKAEAVREYLNGGN